MDISININNMSRQTRDDLVAVLTAAMQDARSECYHYSNMSDDASNDGERRTYIAESNRYDDKASALSQMIIAVAIQTEVQA